MKHTLKPLLTAAVHRTIIRPLTALFPEHTPAKPAPEVPEDIASAMTVVTEAILTDPGYAWGWHCNVAMAAVDAGVPHKAANEAAARFMMALTGADTTVLPEYQALVRHWEVTEEGTEA